MTTVRFVGQTGREVRRGSSNKTPILLLDHRLSCSRAGLFFLVFFLSMPLDDCTEFTGDRAALYTLAIVRRIFRPALGRHRGVTLLFLF